MKLLVTNDDGIEAEGIQTLFRVACQLGEALMIAPAGPQSGCSHRVTVDGSFRIERRDSQHVAVHGTPADCVRLGLHQLATQTTWVLSGINHGGNLGADVYYSGTVAAVREAVLHGFPGIGFSHFRGKGHTIDWSRAERWIAPIVKNILSQPWEKGTFWNINLPSLLPGSPDPEVILCPLDPTPLPLSYRHEPEGDLFHYDGNYWGRQRVPGCDVDVCFSGKIAITQIRLL